MSRSMMECKTCRTMISRQAASCPHREGKSLEMSLLSLAPVLATKPIRLIISRANNVREIEEPKS